MSFRKREYLAGKVAELARAEPSSRLPSIRTLAGSMGASPVTMNRVLKELAQAGVVKTVPGRDGYFPAGYAPAPRRGAAAAPSVPGGRIADLILGDVLRGLLPASGPLPTIKELCHRYGCHYSTLRRALEDLERRGVLTRYRKRYFYRPPVTKSPAGSNVYLLGTRRILHASTLHVYSLVNGIERTLEHAGWSRLRHVIPPRFGDPLVMPDPAVVSAVIFHVETGRSVDLSGLGNVPRVALSPGGLSEAGRRAVERTSPGCFVVESDNRAAGRAAAIMLAELGHRRIAYIHDLDPGAQAWVKLRAEGLAEVFSPGGAPDGRTMTIERAPPAMPKTGGDDALVRLGRAINAARRAARSADPHFPYEILQETFRSPHDLQMILLRGKKMGHHFRRLLDSGGSTAWVCANDMMAVLAMAFLKRNGVSVPEQISVMGFDNTLASWQLGITSYDFAYDRMGHLAAQAVINPSVVRRRFGRHAAIQGAIIPRESVGRPR